MKHKIIDNPAVLLALIAVSCLLGCTKKEYMAPTVGEQIPYTDTVTVSLAESLAASPYTLFNKAWQKSQLDAYLTETFQAGTPFTVLVPTNEAMESAGWNAAAIDAAASAALDTLVRQSVFFGYIRPSELDTRLDNYPAVNIMDYTGIYYYESVDLDLDALYYNPVPDYREGHVPYHFKAYFKRTDGTLWINGKAVGAATPVLATNGILWPIDRVVERPTKTAIQLLEETPDFSLYVELMHYTDSLYNEIFNAANGYYPPIRQGFSPAAASINYRDFIENLRMGYAKTFKYTLGYEDLSPLPLIDTLNTWFIPTNEAFNRAGFKNLDDLKAFNRKRGLPTVEWSPQAFYQVQGAFATDTLLDYHHDWGKFFSPRRRIDGMPGAPNAAVFFSNDLQQELIGNYTISGYRSDIGNENDEVDLVYRMPLYFINDPDGATQLRVRSNTEAPPATVVIKDRYSLNGVIHGVDRLLLPPDFKLN